jgi:hypothetical protein
MDHLGIDLAEGTALPEGACHGFVNDHTGLVGIGHDVSPEPIIERCRRRSKPEADYEVTTKC